MSTKNKLALLFTVFSLVLQAQHFGGVVKLDGLMNRLKNTDTLYVVNFWATWCKPCVQELPAFDSLRLESSNKKIQILLVSLDFKEELDKKVIPFLKKRQIGTTCLLLDETNGNDFIEKIHKDWSGAIPATLFKQGNKTLFREKKVKLKDLQEAIAEFH